MITAFRITACLPLLTVASCAAPLAALPSEGFERSFLDRSQLQTSARIQETELPQADRAFPESLQSRSQASQTSSLLDINAVNAPLDALVFTLATEAGYSLQLNGQLTERVTLKVSQATLPQALEKLSQQTPFAWHMNHESLTIWNGDAFAFSYPVDYLNLDRVTQSSVGLATQVGTIAASDSGGGSIANSSQTRIENTSEYRFWVSLHDDIQGLIENHGQLPTQRTSESAVARFSINAEAGLLTLYAIPSIHNSVKHYLNLLQSSVQRQVLIEATVVEVALSDSFEAGVDWQLLAAGIDGVSAVQSLAGLPLVNAASVNRVTSPAGLVSLVQSTGRGDVSATLSLLEQFGDIRILSRPRIIALNNQSSVLKVVDNRVYFTAKVERSRSENLDEIITETEIHTVPVGLVMNVTPQISASGSVMLNVRPTLSRILGFVNDPNPELAQANVRNGVPEIQVREMESMLNVQSGQVAIIGGLMQETSEQSDSRLPGLGRLPLIRHMFSQRARKHRQTELLILLRPTVVSANLTDASAG